jgi:undecaprenyl pyrophosphate phosphatase UppP
MAVDPNDPTLRKIIELSLKAYHREKREEKRENIVWYSICAAIAIVFWGLVFFSPLGSFLFQRVKLVGNSFNQLVDLIVPERKND